MGEKDITPADFRRHIVTRYSRLSENEDEKIMDSIMDLMILSNPWRRGKSLDSFLEKVASIMQRELFFREISIGLRDRFDGMYRYKLIKGHSKDATDSTKRMEYTYDDMIDAAKYPAIKFGKNIMELSSAVNEDKEEWATFTSPSLINAPRKSIDTLIEADYFHAYLRIGTGELIGFMEFSKWKRGALPPRRIIKWVELLSTIIAEIIWEKEYSH